MMVNTKLLREALERDSQGSVIRDEMIALLKRCMGSPIKVSNRLNNNIASPFDPHGNVFLFDLSEDLVSDINIWLTKVNQLFPATIETMERAKQVLQTIGNGCLHINPRLYSNDVAGLILVRWLSMNTEDNPQIDFITFIEPFSDLIMQL